VTFFIPFGLRLFFYTAENKQVIYKCFCYSVLSASFNAQDQAPDDPYAQDRRCTPCIFVDIPLKGNQVLPRLLTKQEILHRFLQLVSQDSAQELFRHTISPYFGVSWIEFQFCFLWIRFDSQGVVCFHWRSLPG
jgi:hypothetical protein